MADKREEVVHELIKNKLPEEQARVAADCFVTADEYGVFSHGTATVAAHIKRIKEGGYNLNPDIRILRETAAFAVIDGDNSIGPYSAEYCMKYAVEKCGESGVFTVFSRNNNTFGPAFYYPLIAAKNNCIGIVFSNSPAQMAPYGGKEKMLGTNPLSVVIPCGDNDPIIFDIATSVVAKSKFKEYKTKNMKLPEGWALDENGKPTTDPDEAIKGLILPMAGFKGFGLSMIIDIIAGVISGASFLNNVGRFYDSNSCMNVGFCFIAINPKVVFGDEFENVMKEYTEKIRSSQAVEGKKICLPGDDRLECYKKTKEIH